MSSSDPSASASSGEEGGGDPRVEMESARVDVMKHETTIQQIKAALRQLASKATATSSSEDGSSTSKSKSTLRVSALKIVRAGAGNDDDNKEESDLPTLKVLCSSPIEELVLDKIADPLLNFEQALKEKTCVQFEEIEVNSAMLTVTAVVDKKDVGASANYDVAPLCDFDVLTYIKDVLDVDDEMAPGKVSELDVAIVVPDDAAADATNDDKEMAKADDEKKQDTESKDDDDDEDFVDATDENPNDTSFVSATGGDDNNNEADDVDKDKSPVTTEEANTITIDEYVALVDDGDEDDEEGGETKKESSAATSTETSAAQDASSSKSAELLIPTFTIKLRTEFRPSHQHLQDALYEKLNTASQEKAKALDKLRKSAAAVSRGAKSAATTAASTSGGAKAGATATSKDSAVKAGFLNRGAGGKSKEETKTNIFKRTYLKFLGPDSLVRAVFPIAKNYIIFGVAVGLMHFKGHMLALPPPM